MSHNRPMSPLGATLFNLLGESLAPVPVSPIRPNETALGYARRVADTELDALDSLARVDAALHGVVTGKSSLVRHPLRTMSRDAIASLIRSFRAKGHTVKAVGQYPRPGYRYLCSGFEYR